MIKNIPNLLSFSRIIFSILLIPFIHIQSIFIIIYITIGITDVLDGFIARKFKCTSDLGAKLDSMADFTFYIIYLFVFYKLFSTIINNAQVIALVLTIALRFVNMLATKYKYGKVVFIHTLGNKAAGIIVFFVPLLLFVSYNNIVIWIILAIILTTAMEELLITIKYKEPELNRRSIFLD